MRKTHYEAAREYLKDIGYDIPELTRKTRISYPEKITFAEFQILILAEISSLKLLSDIQFAYYSNLFFHLCQLKRNEEKIFYITKDLSVKLADTNLNISSRFLKSPFSEIYVQIERGLFEIIDADDLTKVAVDGFYVFFNNQEIRIMVVGILESTELIPFNDSVFYFRFDLPEGKLHDIVERQMEMASPQELKATKGDINQHKLKELTFFIFNVLLYITSKDPDIINMLPEKVDISNKKSKKKIKKAIQKNNKTSSLPYILVGKKIKSEEVNAVANAGGIVHWKLEKRIYVEGYWRIQWYGSKDDKYAKHIFIEPYYKGPELAELINKKYKVI